ncbi:hypothetical protein [Reichenbachiella faecimaris]|nr:hypothetical protein [Reichenbachiella faecimaris]
MLFRLVKIGSLILVLGLVLVSCESNNIHIPQSNSTSITSKEDLTLLAGQIHFVGALPNGQIVTISPNREYADMSNTEYSDMGGTQFTSEESSQVKVEVNVNQGSGFFELTNLDTQSAYLINFEYTYCNSYRQLRLDYPQLGIDTDLDHYELIVAFSNPDQSVLDLFEDRFILDQYLVAIYDPSRQEVFGYIQRLDFGQNNFFGSAIKEGNKVISEGNMYDSNLYYQFEINCAN